MTVTFQAQSFVEGMEDLGCSVCLDELSSLPLSSHASQHPAHRYCIKKWFERKNICPTCRAEVDEGGSFLRSREWQVYSIKQLIYVAVHDLYSHSKKIIGVALQVVRVVSELFLYALAGAIGALIGFAGAAHLLAIVDQAALLLLSKRVQISALLLTGRALSEFGSLSSENVITTAVQNTFQLLGRLSTLVLISASISSLGSSVFLLHGFSPDTIVQVSLGTGAACGGTFGLERFFNEIFN